MSLIDDDTLEVLCATCEQPVGLSYIRCDEDEAAYCRKCYRQTACYAGDHGEDCRTDVFVCGPGEE